MQIANIFKKKNKNKATEIKNTKRSEQNENGPLRDEKGRFVGKTKEEAEPKVIDKKPQIISVTFYGKEVRKIYTNNTWYFNINDIYLLSTPRAEGQEVKISEKYERIKKEVSHEFEGEDYATSEGIKRLIEEIDGLFPGPLTRWLDESAMMEYIPLPEK